MAPVRTRRRILERGHDLAGPTREVHVTAGHATLRGTEQEARRGVLHRVVVEVKAVDLGRHLGAVGERGDVAGDDLANRDLEAALHHAAGHAGGVDGGGGRPDVEEAAEVAAAAGLPHEGDLVLRGEDGLEGEALPAIEAGPATLRGDLASAAHGDGVAPVAELVAGDAIRVDVDAPRESDVGEPAFG
jgi:hypothetical protein